MHLFTDGSCTSPTYRPLALASWAIISATHTCPIAAGPLAGKAQCINRAELTAILYAARWTHQCGCATTLWTDSAYAASGVWRLQADEFDAPDTSNSDLWQELRLHLERLQPGQFRVLHLSGHGRPDECEDPADEWTIRWNGAADGAAKLANQQREPSFLRLWKEYQRAEQAQLHHLRLFQALHLAVAQSNESKEKAKQLRHAPDDTPDDEEVATYQHSEGQASWLVSLSQDWSSELDGSKLEFQFGPRFPRQVFQWLHQEASTCASPVFVSWLEVAVALRLACIQFPAPAPHRDGAIWRDQHESTSVEGTLGSDVHLTRLLFRGFASQFSLNLGEIRGLNLSLIGVGPPQNGLTIDLPHRILVDVASAIRTFCTGRPIRSANDLARPFR